MKIRAGFGKNASYRNRPGFVAKVVFGKGAGWIGGRTLFLAHNSGSKNHRDDHKGGERFFLPGCRYRWEHIQAGGWELGLTQNANAVPYVSS